MKPVTNETGDGQDVPRRFHNAPVTRPSVEPALAADAHHPSANPNQPAPGNHPLSVSNNDLGSSDCRMMLNSVPRRTGL
jgi:hypothetical protein